ncbi:MAG: hypothetical protein CL388_01690 [Acidiferrobacteraceae bacterium]|nr:hypothetical protein [Acidiferrobacteraceae bacterium]
MPSFRASGSGGESGYWRGVGNNRVLQASNGVISCQLGWREGSLFLDGNAGLFAPTLFVSEGVKGAC